MSWQFQAYMLLKTVNSDTEISEKDLVKTAKWFRKSGRKGHWSVNLAVTQSIVTIFSDSLDSKTLGT